MKTTSRLLLFFTFAGMTACASGPSVPPLRTAWSAPVHATGDAGTTAQRSSDGERLVAVSQFGEYVDVVDAETGQLDAERGQTEVRWAELVTVGTNVGGGGDARAQRDQLIFAQAAPDVLLLMDPSRDEIRALDLETAEPKWVTTDHAFSLEKFRAFLGGGNIGGAQVQTGLGQMMSGLTGGLVEQVLLPQAVGSRVARAVPEHDLVLVATTEGLVGLDPDTGNERFRITEFRGLGVAAAEPADGDLVVVGYNHLDVGTTVRFDPTTGAVRWTADAGLAAAGTVARSGGTLILDNRPPEAGNLAIPMPGQAVRGVDLASGELAYELKFRVGPEAQRWSGPVPLADGFYRVRVSRPMVGLGTAQLVRFGGGEKRWSTPEVKTRVVGVVPTEATVVQAAEGGDFDGLVLVGFDAATGAERWRSEAFDTGLRYLEAAGDRLCGASGHDVFCVGLGDGRARFRHELEGDVDHAILHGDALVAFVDDFAVTVTPDGAQRRIEGVPSVDGAVSAGSHVFAHRVLDRVEFQPNPSPKNSQVQAARYDVPSRIAILAIDPGAGRVVGRAEAPVRIRSTWDRGLVQDDYTPAAAGDGPTGGAQGGGKFSTRLAPRAFSDYLDTGFLVTPNAVFVFEPGRIVRYALAPAAVGLE